MSIYPVNFELQWTESREKALLDQGYEKVPQKPRVKGEKYVSLRGGFFTTRITYKRTPSAFEQLCCSTCFRCLCCLGQPKPLETYLFKIMDNMVQVPNRTELIADNQALHETARKGCPFWYELGIKGIGMMLNSERAKKEIKEYVQSGWNSTEQKNEKPPEVYTYLNCSYFFLVQKMIPNRILAFVSFNPKKEWEDVAPFNFFSRKTGLHRCGNKEDVFEISSRESLIECHQVIMECIHSELVERRARLVEKFTRSHEALCQIQRAIDRSEDKGIREPLLKKTEES